MLCLLIFHYVIKYIYAFVFYSSQDRKIDFKNDYLYSDIMLGEHETKINGRKFEIAIVKNKKNSRNGVVS